MAFIAVILIVIGLINIFARNLVWKLTALTQGMEGVPARRNSAWDIGRVVSGVALVALGGVLLRNEVNSDGAALRPFPGAVAYQRGDDPATDDTIARQELSADEVSRLDWYRVRNKRNAAHTMSDIRAFYTAQVDATQCVTEIEGPAMTCAGPARSVRYMTLLISDEELLLGVYREE